MLDQPNKNRYDTKNSFESMKQQAKDLISKHEKGEIDTETFKLEMKALKHTDERRFQFRERLAMGPDFKENVHKALEGVKGLAKAHAEGDQDALQRLNAKLGWFQKRLRAA